MGKSKHTEAQMIEALKQVEAGRTAAEVGRQCGVRRTRFMRGKPNTAAWR
jgi:putative transposase